MPADRPADEHPPAGRIDVPARLMAAHAAIANLALLRLVETAERGGRLGELPAAVFDAMTVLPAAIQRWQGSEGKQDPGA